MTDRPNRTVAACWIAALLLITLAAYPLSWGPHLYLLGSGKIPDSLVWTDRVYDPLRWLIKASPNCVDRASLAYLEWWFARIEFLESPLKLGRGSDD